MKRRTREEKGITLVALIITIIVLLILAVVAIRAVTGDGIIAHAKNAQTKYVEEQEVEEIQLALNEWSILKNIPSNEEKITDFLKEKLKNYDIVENTDESANITLSNGEKYKATQEGKLIKIIKFYVEFVDEDSGEVEDAFQFYAEDGMTWQKFIDTSYNYLIIDNVEYYFEISSEKKLLLWEHIVGSYAKSGADIEGVNIEEKIQSEQRLKIEVL